MSGGSIKGLEVLLIAGGVFWFAYAQMKALKQPTPGSEQPGGEDEGTATSQTADGEQARNKS
jgi:hypothetical protein